jgi:hypothetical protein
VVSCLLLSPDFHSNKIKPIVGKMLSWNQIHSFVPVVDTSYRNEAWLLDHVTAMSSQLLFCKAIVSVTL